MKSGIKLALLSSFLLVLKLLKDPALDTSSTIPLLDDISSVMVSCVILFFYMDSLSSENCFFSPKIEHLRF